MQDRYWPRGLGMRIELTAVLERGAAAFIYLVRPGDIISDTTLNLWAHEAVPAVREAIAEH